MEGCAETGAVQQNVSCGGWPEKATPGAMPLRVFAEGHVCGPYVRARGSAAAGRLGNGMAPWSKQ